MKIRRTEWRSNSQFRGACSGVGVMARHHIRWAGDAIAEPLLSVSPSGPEEDQSINGAEIFCLWCLDSGETRKRREKKRK
ncbi:hypothetical protein L484_015925 [Morus notabilis]|uniref:Uncharacterized protein n=1 Tax=Morus notabilis TaxID=981085 RepID=W9QZQ6_9ROSA|nr:hypothetical protein L484_015925 [Morus notabilis]